MSEQIRGEGKLSREDLEEQKYEAFLAAQKKVDKLYGEILDRLNRGEIISQRRRKDVGGYDEVTYLAERMDFATIDLNTAIREWRIAMRGDKDMGAFVEEMKK